MAGKASSTARGYGATHRAERAKWIPKVKAGGVKCSRCDQPIDPSDTDWQLDHTDDRTGYLGPAHALCNQSAGGKAGAAVTNAKWAMTTREW